MCGFIITNLNKNLDKYSSILGHRGPNHTGYFKDKNLQIIFNRLAIIDLNKRSNQPFLYKDFLIVFNGEIYNYIELRKELKNFGYKFKTKSDTEVLLYSYIQWGKKFLKKLEGMFSFCIYNKKKNELFVARDRFGIKPLFFYKNLEGFIISSEKKAIFNLGIEKKLNRMSLSSYMLDGVYQQNQDTFYENINSLEPGHCLIVKKNNITINKWFDLNVNLNLKIKFDEAKEELDYLLNESLRYCLRSDKNITIATSGGVDSSVIILKLLEKDLGDKINCLVHWTCDDENDEQNFAKQLSKDFKKKILISHFKKRDFFPYLDKCLKSIEEPFGGLAIMSSTKTFETMKKKRMRVLIDGNGVDEILGGYKHHIDAFNQNKLDYQTQPVQGLKIIFPRNIFKNNFLDSYQKFRLEKKFDDPVKDSMYNDLVGSKLRRALLQQDHNSMSYSIETRFPWLNSNLVNFCFSLPNKFYIKKNIGKYILRKSINKPLFWIPKRPNQTPQTKWMRQFIVPRLIKVLKKDDVFFDLGIFEKTFLIKELNNWKNSDLNNSVFPWYLLMSYWFIKKNIIVS